MNDENNIMFNVLGNIDANELVLISQSLRKK